MEDGRFSKTALMTAYVRGYHALHDESPIIDDALAWQLVPEDARQALERHLAQMAGRLASSEEPPSCPEPADTGFDTALAAGVRIMGGSILARARYVEDCLEEAVLNGVRQYVILGAGLDTFAYRRSDPMTSLQVFEVDHPASQELKRRLIGRIGCPMPESLHFVPVDFERGNLARALANAGFNPQSPAFLSWLGVTHYLPVAAVYGMFTTLTEISCPGSELVFDYWDQRAFNPETSSRRVKSILENTRNIGEPVITGFEPAALEEGLVALGWRLAENLGPEEIQTRLLQSLKGKYTTSRHVYIARCYLKI